MPEITQGSIFWFTTEDGVDQEEQGRHPWIVLSTPLFHRKSGGLVLAVPCTSHDVEYMFDVPITPADFSAWPNVGRPLSKNTPIRIVKARKIRHIAISRIEEVVGLVTNRMVLKRIATEVAAAIKLP